MHLASLILSLFASTEEHLAVYGQEKLEVLISHFGEGVELVINGEEFRSEWEGFKRLMVVTYSHFSMRQMLRHLCTNSSLMDMFPNLSKLATIAALVPVSIAECERSFSAMNRIKMELRNRLKTTTLSCLMRISIEGPSVSDFDYERAADIWGAMRNRRFSVKSSSSS